MLTPMCRLLSLLVNSLFSFYWDVTKDWDLNLLTQSSFSSTPSFSNSHSNSNSNYPTGLRRYLVFSSPTIYYTAIAIDFLLRSTWSLKLSPHLDHLTNMEGGLFFLELLEIGRRWMWIFFRVETEWGEFNSVTFIDPLKLLLSFLLLMKHSVVRNNRGPAPDDILLGDYSGKIDED